MAALAPTATGSTAIVMPDLVGEKWLGAPAAGLGGELCRVRIEYVIDESLDDGTVISQSVAPGTRDTASEGDPFCVTLKVSTKDGRLTLGDYLFFDKESAQRMLEDLGYEVRFEYVPSEEHQRDRVIATYPAAGYDTEIGQRITLTVGKGE